MKKLADVKIKNKLFLLVGAASMFLILLLVFTLLSINKIKNAKNDITNASFALSYIQDADMMHDAIRGDIYRSLQIDKSNDDFVFEAKNELTAHLTTFNEDIETAKKLQLAPEVKQSFAQILPLIENYKVAANSTFDFVIKDYNSSNYYLDKATESYIIDSTNKTIDNSFKLFATLKGDYELNNIALTNQFKTFDEAFSSLEDAMGNGFKQVRLYLTTVQESADKVINSSILTIAITVIILIIACLIFGSVLSNSLQKPVMQTQSTLELIANGEIPQHSKIDGKDELGNMLISLNSLVDNLGSVKQFVNEVGAGNFNTQVELFGNKGDIANSLYSMRDNLRAADIRDKNQNWINSGMANFGDIMRKEGLGMEELCQQMIQYIVKYVNANQGGLFFVNEKEESAEMYWEMMACVAYEKIRYSEKIVNIKDGLLGRIYLEKEYLYFTDIPQNYVHITSGIGDATPACLVIVPLKNNDIVVGAIEIASFTPFKEHELDFIFKMADSVASTVMSIKTNYKTNKLLETTQFQSESMRAQEEELRQNLEELNSTQEEMQIKETIYIKQIADLEAKVNELTKS